MLPFLVIFKTYNAYKMYGNCSKLSDVQEEDV